MYLQMEKSFKQGSYLATVGPPWMNHGRNAVDQPSPSTIEHNWWLLIHVPSVSVSDSEEKKRTDFLSLHGDIVIAAVTADLTVTVRIDYQSQTRKILKYSKILHFNYSQI